MTSARPTRGIRIKGIWLRHSEFTWEAGEEHQRRVDALPENERKRSVNVDVGSQPEAASGTDVRVALTVRIEGRVGTVPFWRLAATFEGEFVVSPDGELSVAQVVDIHGPAWLYSFAREHVADITRRTRVAEGIMLPPFHFARDDGRVEAGTQTAP